MSLPRITDNISIVVIIFTDEMLMSYQILSPVNAFNAHLSFPDSSAGKESACNAEDPSLIPGTGRSDGEGNGYLLQYSGLENSMDCIVHGVAKSWT